MEQILLIISGLITTITGTGYFTFLFMKSKYKQEVEQLKINVLQAKETAETTAIDNDIKLSGHYKEILDDLKARYETRYKEFEDTMNRKVSLHQEELKHFQEVMERKVSLMEEEIKLKDRKIKLQQQEIVELKRENRTLKSNATNSTP